MKTITKILKRLPAIIILCVSWILSSYSTIEQMPSFFGADKIVHMICFAGFAGAWTFWFTGKSWNEHFLRNFLICVLIVSFYGIIDEFHQSFVPGRQVSVFDWLADTVGAMIGSVSGGVLMKLIFKHTNKS